MVAKKIIYSITPFTLLDYPDRISCILWFAGCNMRCTYCYNPEIVFGKAKLSWEDVEDFLLKRRGLLDAVVLSGGECLLYPSIVDLISTIKSLGFLVKIDTNGSKPHVLQTLLRLKLIDYVSLDFKAPLEKTRPMTKRDFYGEFLDSCKILINSDILFEVRTTYHSELLTENDIIDMVNTLENLGYDGKFYIQPFKNGVETIGHLPHSTMQLNLKNTNFTKIEAVIR